jgi:mono/diheme cytochrome c family protein
VNRLMLVTLVLALVLGGILVHEATAAKDADARAALVERGRYITQNVAMCVQCHTPRNGTGELDRTQLFRGAPIPVPAPPFEGDWAVKAPNIVGLLGYSEEDAVRLLTEGRNRTGVPPRPPMPPFRMSREDAAAVIAYLKSLAP